MPEDREREMKRMARECVAHADESTRRWNAVACEAFSLSCLFSLFSMLVDGSPALVGILSGSACMAFGFVARAFGRATADGFLRIRSAILDDFWEGEE